MGLFDKLFSTIYQKELKIYKQAGTKNYILLNAFAEYAGLLMVSAGVLILVVITFF